MKPVGEYRPNWAHVGRSEASPPAEDPEQILGEALTLAAANDRADVVDYLLDSGVPIDATPYSGITALHFGVQFAKPAMVTHLLRRGASVAAVDEEWKATPAGWAEACSDGSSARRTIARLLGVGPSVPG